MPLPHIEPPLLNSSNPWATTLEDLQALFDCPHTGAITTRTSLLNGFEHDDKIHQSTFFNPSTHSPKPENVSDGHVDSAYSASLNTLGYSPIMLSTYLAMVLKIVESSSLSGDRRGSKVIIISVTGSAEAVCECYERIQQVQDGIANPLCMEINLSCPNIPEKPPPAYSGESLAEYLRLLAKVSPKSLGHVTKRVAIGIKTPPYTYHDQFKTLVDALSVARVDGGRCPVDFITATNTLGSSLVLQDGMPAINSASGAGIGGMAGAPLHPLALGM